MCDFVSYIEKGTKIYFLTHDLVFNTPQGEMVRKQCGDNDLCGHGAIHLYFGLEQDQGENREITDFSKPDKFPRQIIKAIKAGEFRGIGIAEQLLTAPAEKAYEEATAPAFWDLFASGLRFSGMWR